MPPKIEGQRADEKDLKRYYPEKGRILTGAREKLNEAKLAWEHQKDRESLYGILGALDALVTIVVLEDYWAGGE